MLLVGCAQGPSVTIAYKDRIEHYSAGGSLMAKRINVLAEVPTPNGPIKYAVKEESSEAVPLAYLFWDGTKVLSGHAAKQAMHQADQETVRYLSDNEIKALGITEETKRLGLTESTKILTTVPR
ncbi:MAG TPA: hypothetical protein VM120_21130 [Bryobacteraceae bacterium]|nr:hypothetical protein [Bryobacteraceae bacterium]